MEKSRISGAPRAEGVIPEEHSVTRREERSNMPSVQEQEGEGGTRGGDKDASFPVLGAASQECEYKFKPSECCARSREFGVPLSRSLQYLRELPNGMRGIRVLYLMRENWFPAEVTVMPEAKSSSDSLHDAVITRLLLFPSNLVKMAVQAPGQANGVLGERKGAAAFDPALPVSWREDPMPFGFFPRLNH